MIEIKEGDIVKICPKGNPWFKNYPFLIHEDNEFKVKKIHHNGNIQILPLFPHSLIAHIKKHFGNSATFKPSEIKKINLTFAEQMYKELLNMLS